jgi:spore coat protein U-like protein
MTCPKRASLSCLLAATLLLTAQAAWSAKCTVSVQSINFGSYDPFNNQNLDSTGAVAVDCNASTAYSISLSPGLATYSARAMASGTHQLLYNLYTNATRTTIWGDGSGGTAMISTTAKIGNHTVYGRIPARQNAFVGNYADTIVVTLTF